MSIVDDVRSAYTYILLHVTGPPVPIPARARLGKVFSFFSPAGLRCAAAPRRAKSRPSRKGARRTPSTPEGKDPIRRGERAYARRVDQWGTPIRTSMPPSSPSANWTACARWAGLFASTCHQNSSDTTGDTELVNRVCKTLSASLNCFIG
eukprot:1193752-Prorocentrum_minimum.AAC.2